VNEASFPSKQRTQRKTFAYFSLQATQATQRRQSTQRTQETQHQLLYVTAFTTLLRFGNTQGCKAVPILALCVLRWTEAKLLVRNISVVVNLC